MRGFFFFVFILLEICHLLYLWFNIFINIVAFVISNSSTTASKLITNTPLLECFQLNVSRSLHHIPYSLMYILSVLFPPPCFAPLFSPLHASACLFATELSFSLLIFSSVISNLLLNPSIVGFFFSVIVFFSFRISIWFSLFF